VERCEVFPPLPQAAEISSLLTPLPSFFGFPAHVVAVWMNIACSDL
jgi:hypothetical protein